jgi:hypothetical protein
VGGDGGDDGALEGLGLRDGEVDFLCDDDHCFAQETWPIAWWSCSVHEMGLQWERAQVALTTVLNVTFKSVAFPPSRSPFYLA